MATVSPCSMRAAEPIEGRKKRDAARLTVRHAGCRLRPSSMDTSSSINMREPTVSVSERARRIRRASLRMVHHARMGHPGGDLSCADILAVLYFPVLRLRPDAPADPARA